MNNGLPFPVRLLLCLNGFFRPTPHPFDESGPGYAEWQFSRGSETLDCFSDYAGNGSLIEGRSVLDVGCGAAGKSVFYATLGAESVVGCDLFDYSDVSRETAEKHGVADKFRFVKADASRLPFPDGAFDTVVMSDFIEHAGDIEKVLSEALRVCRPGGVILINFTSYRHPRGAHLSDAINVPWCQYLFSEKTLVSAYRYLISDKSDREYREKLKLDENRTRIAYINRITIRGFERLLKKMRLIPAYKTRRPLRSGLRLFARLPLLGECFTHSAVYVFEK